MQNHQDGLKTIKAKDWVQLCGYNIAVGNFPGDYYLFAIPRRVLPVRNALGRYYGIIVSGKEGRFTEQQQKDKGVGKA